MNAPTIFISKGDYTVIDDVHHVVLSRDGHGATMQSMGTPKVTVTKTHEELRILYFEERLKIIRAGVEALPSVVQANLERELEEFKPADVEEALRRLEYCQGMRRLHARKLVSKTQKGYGRAARIVARYRRLCRIKVEGVRPDKVPLEIVPWNTLRDWFWRWIKGEKIQALVPGNDRKGRTQQELDPEVVLVIADRISNNWLTLEKPPFTLVYDLIVEDIGGLNVGRTTPLEIPSDDVCRAWKDRNVSKYEEVFYRDGERKAKQLYGHVRRAPQATRPLEIVEIDHTPLDILLVHRDGSPNRGDGRKGRKRTHRVWLTVALCTASRMIVGWHISPDRPSWTAVMTCLRMGILPKDFTDMGCRSPHPVFGVMEVLKLDNGKEFHSRSLKAAAAQLRTELRWTPRRKPHLKGKVERFIGTANRDFLAFLAGRTFRDVRERGDYPSEGRATFTLEEINRLFARWVVDIYHNRPHHGLMGRTPLQRWDDLSGFGVRLPPTAAELFAILALVVERTVTRMGITFLGLTYHCDAIDRMWRRPGHHLGRMYMVKVDPLDLGQVLVLDEEKGRWLEVPCEYPELAEGVSLAQWRANVALARKMTREGSRVSLETLRTARKEIAAEAARRGAKPIRMTQDEVDWYRDHVDDPFFDVAKTAGTEDEERLRAEERQRRRGPSPDPNAPARENPPLPPEVGGGPAAADPIVDDDDDDDDADLIAIID
jgi:putative transposase